MKLFFLAALLLTSSIARAEDKHLQAVNTWSFSTLGEAQYINPKKQETPEVCYLLGTVAQKIENLSTSGSGLLIDEAKKKENQDQTRRDIAKTASKFLRHRTHLGTYCRQATVKKSDTVGYLDQEELTEGLSKLIEELKDFRKKYFSE